jgi:hypothetical protein
MGPRLFWGDLGGYLNQARGCFGRLGSIERLFFRPEVSSLPKSVRMGMWCRIRPGGKGVPARAGAKQRGTKARAGRRRCPSRNEVPKRST